MVSDEARQFDANVGRNAQRVRSIAGLSQTQVAQAMSQRGHSWQQQTVLKVERGSRPLRLSEAADLADFMGVEVRDLYDRRDHELLAAARVLDDLVSTLGASIREVELGHRRLRRAVARVDEATVPGWITGLVMSSTDELVAMARRREAGQDGDSLEERWANGEHQ